MTNAGCARGLRERRARGGRQHSSAGAGEAAPRLTAHISKVHKPCPLVWRRQPKEGTASGWISMTNLSAIEVKIGGPADKGERASHASTHIL